MEAFMGTILPWAGLWAPRGWAFCQGQTLQVAQYQAVYAILGNTYGGTPGSTFCLPNLMGRVPVGAGTVTAQGISMNFIQGQFGGNLQVALTAANMPQHTHTATFTATGGGGAPITASCSLKASTSSDGTVTTPTAGSVLAAPKVITTVPDPIDVALYKSPTAQDQMVELGGISVTVTGGGGITGGTVAVNPSGNTTPTSIPVLQPYQVINYIICLVGYWPDRND